MSSAEITLMPQFLLGRKCKSFPFGQDVALGSRGCWALLLGSTARSSIAAPAGSARRALAALQAKQKNTVCLYSLPFILKLSLHLLT